MGNRAWAWMVAAALAAAPAAAGEAQDRIFRVGLLDGVEAGQTLVYSRERSGSLTTEAVPGLEDATVEVAVAEEGEGRTARIELLASNAPTSRAALSAEGGHPMMLLFLETSARSMADLTGGSPFYIKNRMREALGEDVPVEPMHIAVGGATVAARTMTFRPFANDPNRASMGPFADLAITMVLSEAVPGEFARFEAVAGPDADGTPAFREAITFARLEDR